ncbi:chromate transporter [Allorhizobium sp. BGMRC 0089]|uniref:chromate transporter n=1 Tax=Allorhizobium sonneratiae TaxID=2934936 RepID=UPI002033EAF5|nr:chromate transporter [Allorhizobium sonneratiae]MCM2291600.1 chromate transporter [Allorhizobium sonneratiae]
MSDALPLDLSAEIHPGPAALFSGFLSLGLMGFGGVLPMARRMLVEEKRWLSPEAFTDLLGLCQFLPGGNIINLSVAVGLRFAGWRGALAAMSGLIAAPTAVVLCLGVLYDRYHDLSVVQHLFAGLAAAVAGLLIATAYKMARPLIRKPHAVLVMLICFGAIALLRLPMIVTLLVLAPFSILLSWRASK